MTEFLLNSSMAERAEIERILIDDEKITLDRYICGGIAFHSIHMEHIKQKLKLFYLETVAIMPSRPYNDKKIPIDRDEWLKNRLELLYITYGEGTSGE